MFDCTSRSDSQGQTAALRSQLQIANLERDLGQLRQMVSDDHTQFRLRLDSLENESLSQRTNISQTSSKLKVFDQVTADAASSTTLKSLQDQTDKLMADMITQQKHLFTAVSVLDQRKAREASSIESADLQSRIDHLTADLSQQGKLLADIASKPSTPQQSILETVTTLEAIAEFKDEVSSKFTKLEASYSSLQAELHKPDPGNEEDLKQKCTGNMDLQAQGIGVCDATNPGPNKVGEQTQPRFDPSGTGYKEEARILSFSEVHEMAHADVPLVESVWDSTVFVGFDSIGLADSISIGIGAVLNCCIQVAFCLIIYVNFASNTIDADTILAVKRWRAIVGHDIQFADPLMQASLVSQVCGGNTGLHLSGSQVQMSGDLREYMEPEIENHFLRKLDGWVLCNLSLLLFYWSVFCDFRANTKLFGAVLSHRTGRPCIEVDGDGNLSISILSLPQKTMVFFLAFAPRLAVEILLLISGATFLSYTGNIGDLVLNAVALGFILDIDEVSYSIFVPTRVKHLLEQVGSISMGIVPHPHFEKFRAMLVVCISFLALLLVNIVCLLPFQSNIADAYKWLCSGEKDFVYTIDKASGLVYWHATNEFELQPVSTYAERALVALTGVDSYSKAGSWAIEISNWNSIDKLYKEGVATASQQLKCIDHLESEYKVLEEYSDGARYYAMLDLMRELTSNASLASCQHVPRHLCNMHQAVRAACPLACGCDSPWSGLIFATPDHGCPGVCRFEYDSFLHDTRLMTTAGWKGIAPVQVHLLATCQDTPVETLRNLDSWKNYVHTFRILAETYVGPGIADTLATKLSINGCEGAGEVSERYGMRICEVGAKGIGRSARPWCPCSCNCLWVGTPDRDECPMSCHDPALISKECGIEREDIRNIQEGFLLIDTNGDFLLTEEELRTALRTVPQGADHSWLDQMVQYGLAFDENGDGFLDTDEYEGWQKDIKEKSKEGADADLGKGDAGNDENGKEEQDDNAEEEDSDELRGQRSADGEESADQEQEGQDAEDGGGADGEEQAGQEPWKGQ